MSPRIDHRGDFEPFDVDAYEPADPKSGGYFERITDQEDDRG